MRRFRWLVAFIVLMPFLVGAGTDKDNPGCASDNQAVSDAGVVKATAEVQKQANGLTVEQQNVKDRLLMDNKPGSTKYLYVISPYSGQCILYSTVRGKVTSSGKRLNPLTVEVGNQVVGAENFVNIAGSRYNSKEIIEDDGTYGTSCPYVFWWDTKGTYRQLFLTGSVMVVVSDVPLPVHNIIININSVKE